MPLGLEQSSLFHCVLQLSRLRRSYEKLQKKKTRSRGEANKGQEEDKFELSRLTRKLEVCGKKKQVLTSLCVLTDLLGFTGD